MTLHQVILDGTHTPTLHMENMAVISNEPIHVFSFVFLLFLARSNSGTQGTANYSQNQNYVIHICLCICIKLTIFCQSITPHNYDEDQSYLLQEAQLMKGPAQFAHIISGPLHTCKVI